MLPEGLRDELECHLQRVRVLFETDRKNNLPGVWLPEALGIKYRESERRLGVAMGVPVQDV